MTEDEWPEPTPWYRGDEELVASTILGGCGAAISALVIYLPVPKFLAYLAVGLLILGMVIALAGLVKELGR